MRRRAFTASAFATALASPAIAQAQWPAKPLRLVIPYPPGGPSDVSSRIVMERAAQLLGQGVLFDNKAGASGMIGAEFVKNQPVDHHTFLTTTTAMVCITRHLQPIPFDPDRDIIPVSRMTTSWGAFAVHPSVPANTVAEFVAYAKANPGKLNYGSAGLATITHLFGEMLCLEAGIKMTHVPYRGSAPSVEAFARGEIELTLALVPESLNTMKSTQGIKPLAIAADKRSDKFPDTPTFGELGYPKVQVYALSGLMAPAGTPQPIVDKISKDTMKALQDPAVKERLVSIGIDPVGSTPEAFANLLKEEFERWEPLIRANNIKAE